MTTHPTGHEHASQIRGVANLIAASAPLKAAVAKDPKFARAWEMLGAVLVTRKYWDVGDAADLQTGADAIDIALRLDPSLSLAYAVRGEVQLYMIPGSDAAGWDDSLNSYSLAIEHDATDATAYAFRAQNYAALGYFDRAIGWRFTRPSRVLALSPSPASLTAQAVYINEPVVRKRRQECSCAMSFDEDALIDAHR